MAVATTTLACADMTPDLRPAAYGLSSVPSSEESRRVRADVSDHVFTVTLDRPERRNALDGDMRDELAAALSEAARSTSTVGEASGRRA